MSEPVQLDAALDAALERLKKSLFQRRKTRIEAAMQPGETFAQAEARLDAEEVQRQADEEAAKVEQQRSALAASRQRQAAETAASAAVTKPPATIRQAPKGDEQADFFVPSLYDMAGRDSRHIMDVAPFRLSKDQKRAGEVIRYDLPDGYVEVKAGPDGMASVWDYDIVLMMVSHMTEATNRYRDGKGDKPGRTFRPHVSDILKFARRGDGGKQLQELEAALDRLSGTRIKSVRERTENGKVFREVEAEGLISRYSVLSRTDTGRISSVEIEAPQWIHQEIVGGKNPDVLSVHPDYFLINPGIGRFVYRLARRAAGKGMAKWSFQTIYERSGSTGEFKKFCQNLRRIIAANDLPEYDLREEKGQSGPQLIMTHRSAALALPSEGEEGEGT